MAPWLLIDNSNTRTKFVLADAHGLHEWHRWLPTNQITRAAVHELLDGIEFSAVMLCSVVPPVAAILRETLSPLAPVADLNADSPMEIGIDYPNPKQIGADRLANAVGVHAHYGAPAIVIDFGTAVTFDVLSKNATYSGGVIAPGLGAMNEYLTRRTALLPPIDLAEPSHAIGRSTEEAMQVGAVFGYRGLVREIIAKLCAEIEGKPRIIATGGDAALIARGLSEIETVDAQLTLEGIRLVACRTFSRA